MMMRIRVMLPVAFLATIAVTACNQEKDQPVRAAKTPSAATVEETDVSGPEKRPRLTRMGSDKEESPAQTGPAATETTAPKSSGTSTATVETPVVKIPDPSSTQSALSGPAFTMPEQPTTTGTLAART